MSTKPIPAKEKAEAERLKERGYVKTALALAGTEGEKPRPVAETKDRLWFTGYLLLLIALGALSYLLTVRFLGFSDETRGLLQRLLRGGLAIVFILGVAKASEVYLIGRIADAVSRYNLRRIQKLVVTLALAFTVVTMLFVNWYTAALSLGLISLILGFALQTPITSFIGWVYIMD